MGGLNNKSKLKDIKHTSEVKNGFNLEYSYKNNFEEIIFIPLILDQILQFINDNDKQNLFLCNKKFYQLYCNQITKIQIYYKNINKSNKSRIINVLNKYKNLEYLEINDCNDITFLNENYNIKSLNLRGNKNSNLIIKDFSPLYKLD